MLWIFLQLFESVLSYSTKCSGALPGEAPLTAGYFIAAIHACLKELCPLMHLDRSTTPACFLVVILLSDLGGVVTSLFMPECVIQHSFTARFAELVGRKKMRLEGRFLEVLTPDRHEKQPTYAVSNEDSLSCE
ncbi:hypothetical protein ACLOJK_010608 [Asimina triloba]